MATSTSGSFRPFALAAATAFGAVVLLTLNADQQLAPPAAAGAALAPAIPGPAVGAAAGDGTGRTAPASARGCWTAPAGSAFRYRLGDRVDVTLHSPEGGTQPGGALHTDCEVVTVVLDRRDGEVLTALRVERLRFLDARGTPIVNDPVAAAFADGAREPVFARIDGDGRVLGLGFADGLDGDQRNFLRGTLALLFAETPRDGATTWTSEGHDTTGVFTARHELVPAAVADAMSVRRTRERYTRIVGQSELPQHELRGASTAHFALERGWLHGVELAEGMTLALSLLDLQAITERRATVTLLAAGTEPVSGDLARVWAAATAPPTSDGETVGAHASHTERRLWQQRLQGVSLGQLLADLQRLLAAQPVDGEALDAAFQQLQWLLRLDDREVAAMAEQLATSQVNAEVARVAIGAFGAAGSPAAQQALVALRADCSLAPELREAATMSSLQLASPGRALIEGLVAEAGGESALRGSSLLVLGALAPRSRDPLGDGRSALDALLAMEPEAARRGELDTWVLAVGNSRAPQALAIATRLLAHERAAVRGACCVALRSLPAAGALTALVERGLTDVEPSVRHEAVMALARRPEPAARDALERAAANDPDAGVRERAQRLLRAPS